MSKYLIQKVNYESVDCCALHKAIAKCTESMISIWEASTSRFTALNSMTSFCISSIRHFTSSRSALKLDRVTEKYNIQVLNYCADQCTNLFF